MNNIIDKLIMGSDSLAGKFSGLLMKRIAFIINCSCEKENIFPQNFNYIKNNNEIGTNMFTDDQESNLKQMFNKHTKEAILLHSENMNKTRMIYCIILMKILRVKLKHILYLFCGDGGVDTGNFIFLL
jgi:hypothetical protein